MRSTTSTFFGVVSLVPARPFALGLAIALFVAGWATTATATPPRVTGARSLQTRVREQAQHLGQRVRSWSRIRFRREPQATEIPNRHDRQAVIGVVGGRGDQPGAAAVERDARTLGSLIGQTGWAVVTGGGEGVEASAARGVKEAGGTTLAIRPGKNRHDTGPEVDIPVSTGMGEVGRYGFTIQSSDVVVAMRGGAETMTQASMALETGKPLIVVNHRELRRMRAFREAEADGRAFFVRSPAEAMRVAEQLLGSRGRQAVPEHHQRGLEEPRARIVGVMGGNASSRADASLARFLGRRIAARGHITLNGAGGGIMGESSRGAKEGRGRVLGVSSSGDPRNVNRNVDHAILTDAKDARNQYNVLSSDVVIALPGRAGTKSEIALALKNGRNVVVVNQPELMPVFQREYAGQITFVSHPNPKTAARKAMKAADRFLKADGGE
jgi:hypothetical protein